MSPAQLQRLRSRELPRAYELLGRSQEELGHLDIALRAYQLGVALFPKDVSLLTQLGNLLHRSGLDGQARVFYERILRLSPDNASAHLGLGQTERRLGFLDRAATHYEATLKEWGHDWALWRDYAELLFEHRRHDQALKAAERSLTLNDHAVTRLYQARILWSLNRKADAFAALARARSLAPEWMDPEQQEALWSLEAGDLSAAESACAKLLKRTPDDPLALWLRASVALRQGRPQQATADLERAARQVRSPFVAAAAQAVLRQLP